jgi:hypothetical protein
MESAFETGQHVVVELDESTIAGVLVGSTEDGWVIKVTHKLKKVPKTLPKDAVEKVTEYLGKSSNVGLRFMMWKNKVHGWRTMEREEMLEIAGFLVEQDILAEMEEVHTLTPLLSPVTTFVNGGIVRTMEITDDRNMDALLSNLDFEPELSDEELGVKEDDGAPTGD